MLRPAVRTAQNSYSSFTQWNTLATPIAQPLPQAPPSKQPRRLGITAGTNDVAAQKAENYKKRNLLRIKTIEDRINPATGKKSRSFIRSDGTPKLIERPC